MPTPSPKILMISNPITGKAFPPWKLLNVAMARNTSITRISWTIRMPMESLQNVLSVCSLSESNFKTTMVLLNANPAQI